MDRRSWVAACVLLCACGGGGDGGGGQTPPPPPPSGGGDFTVRRVNDVSFDDPMFVAGIPDGSGRLWVVERAGQIWILDPNTGDTLSPPFIDLRDQTDPTDGERGLSSIVPAPDYATSGDFYVFITRFDNPEGALEVRRYQRSDSNPNVADEGAHDVILQIPHDGAANHNGGWIGFGADGNLFVSTGDGGTGGAPSQNTSSFLGKILRIDVDSGDGIPGDDNNDYTIPPGNPIADSPIWALGLRNPFRASIDPVTGDLFIGDVGEAALEEIDRMSTTAGEGGVNFGWPHREGTNVRSALPPGVTAIPPVAEYGRTVGRTVIGGVVYRGSVDALQGEYLFADFIEGVFFSVPATSLVTGSTLGVGAFTDRTADFAPVGGGSIDFPVAFGTDTSGEVYIVDLASGGIFRIEEE